MALAGVLWLLSPFVVIAVVSTDEEMRRKIGEHHGRFRAAGLAGVLMLCLGAVLAPALVGTLLYLIGTPLVGFVVWLPGDDGDDGGEGDPDVPPIDWDDFERSLWSQAPSRTRNPPGPRTPSAS